MTTKKVDDNTQQAYEDLKRAHEFIDYVFQNDICNDVSPMFQAMLDAVDNQLYALEDAVFKESKNK